MLNTHTAMYGVNRERINEVHSKTHRVIAALPSARDQVPPKIEALQRKLQLARLRERYVQDLRRNLETHGRFPDALAAIAARENARGAGGERFLEHRLDRGLE